jgi:hypothetical protein
MGELGVSWFRVRRWASDHFAAAIGAAGETGVMGALGCTALRAAIHRRKIKRMMRTAIPLARL